MPEKSTEKKVVVRGGGSGDSVYGIGVIGAWIYFFRGVTTFKEGAIAFGKGLAWPAFLVYEALKYFNVKKTSTPPEA